MKRKDTLKTMSLLELLKEAAAWNRQDIRGFEDITPDLPMLRARARVLRAAIVKAKGAR